MSARMHWEKVYGEKSADEVSWYQPHLGQSLRMIEAAAPHSDAAIIDVGGGESTLVDDLVARGFGNVAVLDISEKAINTARERLGSNAADVTWRVADVTEANLPSRHYAVWHDRAVFHFLVEPEQRARYVRQLLNSLTSDGHVVIATFGPNGPAQCSGLTVERYDLPSLHDQLGADFELVDHCMEQHRTPGGREQEFLYAHFKRQSSPSSEC